MTHLENFIRMHRTEFDVYQPGPEVWAGIASGLTASVLLPKPGKFFGPGAKTLLLVSAVTSAILVGIWSNKAGDPKETKLTPVTKPVEKETATPVEPKPASGMRPEVPASPVAAEAQVWPAIPIEIIGPFPYVSPVEIPQPMANPVPPAFFATEPGDTSFSGIKKLTLKCPGYRFRISRSGSKLTTVRIAKQGEVKDKNKENAVPELKIEQKDSELLFGYGQENSKRGWGSGYEIVRQGEIEILIPDEEIDQITTHSSDIDLSDYTARVLSIQSVSGNIHVSGVQGTLNCLSASGDQTFTGVGGDLQVNTVSGDVSVKDQSGNCKIRTSSGEIGVQNCQGDAGFHSLSGGVRATGIKGKLTITSASGDQYLTDITGDLQSTSVSGDVSLKDQAGNVGIVTSSGEITVSNSLGDISCHSISGGIRLEGVEGKLDLRTGSGDVSGESVGLVGSCVIQTVSGDVNMGLKNSAEDLSFDLRSISGDLKIKKGNTVVDGEKSIKTGTGKIRVTGETSSGDQVYR